jgi:hypothetical protein
LCPSGLAAMGLCWHEPNSSGPTTYFSCLSTYAYKNEQTCASLCFQCPEERGKTSFIEPPNTKATFVIRLDSRKYIDTHTHKYSQKTLRDLPCRDTPFSSAMLKPEGLGLSQMFPYCPYLDPPPF